MKYCISTLILLVIISCRSDDEDRFTPSATDLFVSTVSAISGVEIFRYGPSSGASEKVYTSNRAGLNYPLGKREFFLSEQGLVFYALEGRIVVEDISDGLVTPLSEPQNNLLSAIHYDAEREEIIVVYDSYFADVIDVEERVVSRRLDFGDLAQRRYASSELIEGQLLLVTGSRPGDAQIVHRISTEDGSVESSTTIPFAYGFVADRSAGRLLAFRITEEFNGLELLEIGLSGEFSSRRIISDEIPIRNLSGSVATFDPLTGTYYINATSNSIELDNTNVLVAIDVRADELSGRTVRPYFPGKIIVQLQDH